MKRGPIITDERDVILSACAVAYLLLVSVPGAVKCEIMPSSKLPDAV